MLFGGWDSTRWTNADVFFTQVWRLNQEWKWELVEVFGEPPCSRRGHSASLAEDGSIVVFGGIYGYSKLLDDVYRLS